MAARLVMLPELWCEILDQSWGVRDPNEMRGLWNDTRLVSKHFKNVIERIFKEEHVPKTQLVFAISVKKEVPASVYATNLNFVYLRIADNERLRNHSFTLEFEFSGFATEDSNRAIFRRRAWLDDAHTYDYFGPQTFGCTGEQGNGGSFQGFSGEEPWAYPEPKHVEFEGSLDHVISNIDTTSGAMLIKVRENAIFADNCLLPALKVAAYRGEVSLEWKPMCSILYKELEAGQQLRERPERCNSVAEMIEARPLCPFSKLLGPTTQCYCHLD